MGPGFLHTAKFRGHERFPIGTGVRPTSPHWDDVGGKVSNHCEQFGATVVPIVGTSGRWFPTGLSHQIPLRAQSAHGSIPPPHTPNPTHHARHSHPPRPNQGRTLEGGSQGAVSSLAPPEWAAATPKRLGPDQVYRVGIRIWALHGGPKLNVDFPKHEPPKGPGSDQVYRVRVRIWTLHGGPKLKVDFPEHEPS